MLFICAEALPPLSCFIPNKDQCIAKPRHVGAVVAPTNLQPPCTRAFPKVQWILLNNKLGGHVARGIHNTRIAIRGKDTRPRITRFRFRVTSARFEIFGNGVDTETGRRWNFLGKFTRAVWNGQNRALKILSRPIRLRAGRRRKLYTGWDSVACFSLIALDRCAIGARKLLFALELFLDSTIIIIVMNCMNYINSYNLVKQIYSLRFLKVHEMI